MVKLRRENAVLKSFAFDAQSQKRKVVELESESASLKRENDRLRQRFANNKTGKEEEEDSSKRRKVSDINASIDINNPPSPSNVSTCGSSSSSSSAHDDLRIGGLQIRTKLNSLSNTSTGNTPVVEHEKEAV